MKSASDILSKRSENIEEVKTNGTLELETPRPKRSIRVLLHYLAEHTDILWFLKLINNLICLITYLLYLVLAYYQISQYEDSVSASLSRLRTLPSSQ